MGCCVRKHLFQSFNPALNSVFVSVGQHPIEPGGASNGPFERPQLSMYTSHWPLGSGEGDPRGARRSPVLQRHGGEGGVVVD